MKKNTVLIGTILAITLTLNSCSNNQSPVDAPMVPSTDTTSGVTTEILNTSPLYTSYTIDGKSVQLNNGKSETAIASGSATKDLVTVFSYDKQADVDSDGTDDTIVLLTKDMGGSGLFYYVAVAMHSGSVFLGSEAVLIGDRISPQNTEFKDGKILVSYLTRKPWESFIEQTSEWASKILTYENGKLNEVMPEQLNPDIAQKLILDSIWDCTKNDCTDLIVNAQDWKDWLWYVEAILEWLQDDSIRAKKQVYRAQFVNEQWELWAEVLSEIKCQLGRGHEDFSKELCI